MTGIAVVGVTASGKSELAVLLAKRHSGEVISCDSMLVYRGCDIGTAKPSLDEMGGIKHHLVDILDPEVPFNAADFAGMCESAEGDIVSRGKMPIICGGTGLYLDCFLRGGLPEELPRNDDIRKRLENELLAVGAKEMHRRLMSVDKESADAVHFNNTRRVIRALEIYELTGKTKTELDKLSPQRVSTKDYCVVALDYENKALRAEMIERRVRKMFDMGLEEETRRLLSEGVFEKCAAAAQAIGYKELFPYLEGREGREDAIMRLTYATRRYAKRQTTWFKALPYARALYVDENGKKKNSEALAKEAEELLGIV